MQGIIFDFNGTLYWDSQLHYDAWREYSKILRERAYQYFENDEELANYVIEVCYIQRYHQSKSFAWCVFGDQLLRNLMRNTSQPITIPVQDNNGNIDYLFNRYSLKEVCIDRSEL